VPYNTTALPMSSSCADASNSGDHDHSSDTSSHPPGYLFICNSRTEPECLERMLFGLPASSLPSMLQHINPGSILFQYNRDKRYLRGPYYALGRPARDIVPGAFQRSGPRGRPFPAQVRMEYSMLSTATTADAAEHGVDLHALAKVVHCPGTCAEASCARSVPTAASAV